MPGRFLLDTDVLIDFFRKHPQAVAFMNRLGSRPVLSVVTVAELFSGVREGSERIEIETFLRRSVLIETDEQICIRAGLILRQFRKSHGTGLADALIASSAENNGATLVTLNRKHFPMLLDVVVPYVKA